MIKKILILITLLVAAHGAFAATPALIVKGAELDGAKKMEVTGAKMVFARRVLKRYPIAPLSDSVNEVYVLTLKKTSKSDRDMFLNELKNYRYYGKFDCPDGLVDVYVHLKSDDRVDELVIYNPVTLAISCLVGDFSVADLIKLDSKPGK